MKRIVLSLVLIVLALFRSGAQDKTIIIVETGLPYTSQSWFYEGRGNSFSGEEISKNWDEGRRITSIAYTNNGWFCTMAKNTGIGMQSYKVDSDWPGDWIDEKWKADYHITALARSGSEWCVVMSQGSGYSSQRYMRDTWDQIRDWYSKNINEGYFMTDAVFSGKYWTVVMSRTPKYSSQGYLFANTYDDLVEQVKTKVWDRSYRVHHIVYGNNVYLVTYGNYGSDNGRGQSYVVDPSDVSGYIDKKWNDSARISYIGGGYAGSSSGSGSGGRYLGKRTGRFYYVSDTNQQAELNFYWNNGDYLASSSTLGIGYGSFPRYVLRDETADSYVFYRANLEMSGRITVLEYLPKMIVSKGWNRIVLEKAVMGKDMILTKEISKEEYDKISQAKANFFNGIGLGGSNQNNSSGGGGDDGGASYVDGPCKYCGGGGGCSSCNGTGLKYNSYGGYYDQCPSCSGSGRCFNCRGTGKQRTY